jgi:rhodanese-related sulfurtransferase
VRGGACVVDLRDPGTYGEAHVAGALNVWIESPQFADRVAAFVPPGAPILLMSPGPADLERAVQALARVGVDDVVGFLQWGMIEWRSEDLPVESVPQITVHDLSEWLEQGQDVVVVDVRETFEWMDGHIDGALHVPMLESAARRGELPGDRPKAVLCAGGLRSSTVISALKRHGLDNWYNVTGGMTSWLKAGYPVERPSAVAPPARADVATASVSVTSPPGVATTPDPRVAATLDCRGLTCPMPNIKLAQALKPLEPGALIEMLATDPGASADLDAFEKHSRHRVVERSESHGVLRFVVRRGR